MSDNSRNTKSLSALWFSVAWLVAALLYAAVCWDRFKIMKPNEWADFAAGVAAPLAFLWLVLGYFLQREELKLQREELMLQRQETARLADAAKRQADSIEANESLTKRESFLRFAAFLIDGMNADVVTTLKLLIGAREVADRRSQWGRSDWAFYYELLLATFVHKNGEVTHYLRNHSEWVRVYGLMVRYSERYEKLLQECDAIDEQRKFRAEYEWSDYAKIYMAFSCVLHRPSPFKIRMLPTLCSDIE